MDNARIVQLASTFIEPKSHAILLCTCQHKQRGFKTMLRRAVRTIVPHSIRKKLIKRLGRSSSSTLQNNKERAENKITLAHAYTIVSAVYNMEKYLDDFFSSIFNQSCDTSNISIVLVDDGSTDSSASIIHTWQEKYPGQIEYIFQENGGPGAARNRGFQNVKTEWVTFIDSDDKVAPNYFEEVDKAISKHPNIVLATCRLFYWHMKDDRLQKESLIMRHFRKNVNFYYAVGDEQMPPIFFMNASFFKTDLLRKHDLAIDGELRPNFEDGKFVAQYLLSVAEGLVGYIDKAHYYYRKRADLSSLIDKSWEDPRKYLLVPERGYLEILEYAKRKVGHVPLNIQQTILQDLSWFFKELENQPGHAAKIGSAQDQKAFLDILRRIFKYISLDTLFSMPGGYLSFRLKNGIARTFMNQEPPYMLCKLKMLMPASQLMLIETFDENVSFYFDGMQSQPLEVKRADTTLCGEFFYSRYEIWLQYPKDSQIFSYRLSNGTEARLSIQGGKPRPRSIGMSRLIKQYTKNWSQYQQTDDTWLFMDRDTRADDNAEHLYRYVMKNHPEQQIAFALNRSSADWERLEKEGFNLIDFGTNEFEGVLKSASTILSSQADAYVYSYFGDKFFGSKRFVFLQHGIIMNDLSSWLNTLNPSLMLSSTPQEKDFLTADGSTCIFTPRQVPLTGLPRHDGLLEKRREHEQTGKQSTLLILPTWRRYLSGGRIGQSATLELSPIFRGSPYQQKWEELLKSDRLKSIADDNNLRIVFCPHPNILPYIEERLMEIPSYIDIANIGLNSYQDLIANAAVCITDYSSASLDASLAGVPVVYYQFDAKDFFGGDHGLAPGYFDFQKDGFGPIAEDEETCLDEVDAIGRRAFRREAKYSARAAEYFTMADGRSCERVYQAVSAL